MRSCLLLAWFCAIAVVPTVEAAPAPAAAAANRPHATVEIECLGERECVDRLKDVSEKRRQLEAKALRLLGLAVEAGQRVGSAEATLRQVSTVAQGAESEAGRWLDKVAELQGALRPLTERATASAAQATAAARADHRAKKEEASALEEERREAAVSGMTVQDRCRANIVACGAGLVTLRLRLALLCLRIEGWQFLLALVFLVLGAIVLMLSPRVQAALFAAVAMIGLPALACGAFKDFAIVVSSSPSVLMARAAGCVVAGLSALFLWQGRDGLRLILGAWQAAFIGALILVTLAAQSSSPEAFSAGNHLVLLASALTALGLACLGATGGFYWPEETLALAMALLAALMFTSGTLLILGPVLGSSAYLDQVVSALMPWPDPDSEQELGSFASSVGRVIWLLLLLFTLLQLAGILPPILLWKKAEKQAPAAQPKGAATNDVEKALSAGPAKPAVPAGAKSAGSEPPGPAAAESNTAPASSFSSTVPKAVESNAAASDAAPPAAAAAAAAASAPAGNSAAAATEFLEAGQLITQMVQTLQSLKEALPNAASASEAQSAVAVASRGIEPPAAAPSAAIAAQAAAAASSTAASPSDAEPAAAASEEVEASKRAAEEEEARRKSEARRHAAEEDAKKKAADAQQRKEAEEEKTKRQAAAEEEKEEARRQAAEIWRKAAAEEAQWKKRSERKAAEEEAQRQAAEEKRKKATEEEDARKRAAEDAQAKKSAERGAAEEEAKRLAAEEERRKAAQENEARKKAAEEDDKDAKSDDLDFDLYAPQEKSK